jgi:hypothetical protein
MAERRTRFRGAYRHGSDALCFEPQAWSLGSWGGLHEAARGHDPAAVGGTPDGRWPRPAPPRLTPKPTTTRRYSADVQSEMILGREDGTRTGSETHFSKFVCIAVTHFDLDPTIFDGLV